MGVHLDCPPPVASVHLVIHTACSLLVGVVALRHKCQVTRELRVTIERPNTLQDVTEVEWKWVTCYNQVLTREWWAAW